MDAYAQPQKRAAPPGDRSTFSDPVFGTTYDTKAVHFETAPARIAELCRDMGRGTIWVFAHWRQGDDDYYVVSSYMSETSGIGVVIQRGVCVEGLPEWILSGNPEFHPFKEDTPVVFNALILRGLATDLLRRMLPPTGARKNSSKRSGSTD